jgi:hypothetical protein
MSIRTIAAGAAAAALLAAPAAASARPGDPAHPVGIAPATAAPEARPANHTVVHDGGAATLTVLVIGAGGLLAGAAGGFEGGRAVARRRAVRA